MFKYSVILWDIDGTILNFLAAEKAAIQRGFQEFNIGECTDEMLADYSQINKKYWEMLERKERREIYQKMKQGEAVTTAEVSVFLQIERKTIDFLRRTNWIEGTKKGCAYLYDAMAVLEWCDEEKKHYNNISEWLDEGVKRFGRDVTNWKFQCPQCKRIYSVGEYPDACDERRKLLQAAKKCIDRHRGCTYQYFNVTKNVELAKGGIVVEHNGRQFHFFDYADIESGEI